MCFFFFFYFSSTETPSQMISLYFGIHNQNIISAINRNIFEVLNYSVNEETYNFFQMKYAQYRSKKKMKACRKRKFA